MSNIPGADARQSPYASTLASIEPEGLPALAAAALELFDAINQARLVVNPDLAAAQAIATSNLIESLYPLQDALHGAADTLPAALAGFLSTANMSEKSGYVFGAYFDEPFAVTLTIDARTVAVDRFRADLPRIAAKLEHYLADTRAEALR
ncbi:MAG: hypothetical protein RKP46_11720 [Candidatus Accumulibacter sp.]|uniref:hypothetical protein n=1 Tax=Accumulibacter sp. TaxID=2053492 RepID=UPI00287A1117|nr:hypothetical protein [Accumulibacter sp.]MDS4014999.1 hypothetical protein [Accumulibacter sp.]